LDHKSFLWLLLPVYYTHDHKLTHRHPISGTSLLTTKLRTGIIISKSREKLGSVVEERRRNKQGEVPVADREGRTVAEGQVFGAAHVMRL